MKIKNLFILPLLAGLMLVGCKNKEVKPSEPEIVDPSEPSEPSEPEDEIKAEDVIRSIASLLQAEDTDGDNQISIEELIDPVLDVNYWETEENSGVFETGSLFLASAGSQAELVSYGMSIANSILPYNSFTPVFGEVYTATFPDSETTYTECDASVNDKVTLEVYSYNGTHATYGEVIYLIFDAYLTPAE